MSFFKSKVNESKCEEIEKDYFKNVKTKFNKNHVFINQNKDKIWTFSANTESKNTPIVLIHGFLASIGVWRFNIDTLAESRPVYAIDLLGFGRSSRPKFSNDPSEAENTIIDSIEQWRKQVKLDKFILLGHSFGGYIVASYAIKFSKNVAALILLDPWGINDLNDQKCFEQMKFYMTSIYKQLKSPTPFRKDDLALKIKYFFYADYYKILSGNKAFYTMLNLNLYINSKNPIIKRIDLMNKNLPIWYISGENSWISPCFFKIAAKRPVNSVTHIRVIENAGHNVQRDNPTEFNQYMRVVLKDIDENNLILANE